MGWMMPLILTVVGVSLLISFFCSISESALYSISRTRVETLRREGGRRGAVLHALREDMNSTISAILILNTVANTVGAAWAGALVGETYGNSMLGWFAAAFTAAVLFFSEIIPKSLGFHFAARVAPHLAGPIRLLVWVLAPAVAATRLVTRLFERPAPRATEKDLLSLAALVERAGMIRPQERKWIANALYLDKKRAGDLMTPLGVVRAVESGRPLDSLRGDDAVWTFSRIPVHAAGDPGSVVGVLQRRLFSKALAEGNLDAPVDALMDPPLFVSDDAPADELLGMFVRSRRHLFCVRDEHARWRGIVTLEDVLEALLGTEIVGEQDVFENMQDAAYAKAMEGVVAEAMRAGGVLRKTPVAPGSRGSGATLGTLELPQGVRLGPVQRGDDILMPDADLQLAVGDVLSLAGPEAAVAAAERRFSPPSAD